MRMNLCWLRRDLRLFDQHALSQALRSGLPTRLIFIFDPSILDDLDATDRRVAFIHQKLAEMNRQLQSLGSSLWVFKANPEQVFKQLSKSFQIQAVYTNHDYEPYATTRDEKIREILEQKGIELLTFKDQVIFERAEVVKPDGLPYTVFTPYSKRWKALFTDDLLVEHPTLLQSSNLHPGMELYPLPDLEEIGFQSGSGIFPAPEVDTKLLSNYHNTRDIPAMAGTSQLGIHLRFGTISIRQLMKQALLCNTKYVDELIWREFYQSILWHFPLVIQQSFKPAHDRIAWRNNTQEFEAWCQGQTGYPIVDAGMRELLATGWMHNRVRMITASFLTKHLLIDWRWGEAWFAKHLNDFDLASNNGGWQWAAGCGVDAAPYFRIFNPSLQTARFDPDFTYIRKWVPEFESLSYPRPIVDHAVARARCLKTFQAALQ